MAWKNMIRNLFCVGTGGLTYFVLDCRTNKTILPVGAMRRCGWEQCGTENNCQITYGHWVLRFILYNPESNISMTDHQVLWNHTCVNGPRNISGLHSWHPASHWLVREAGCVSNDHSQFLLEISVTVVADHRGKKHILAASRKPWCSCIVRSGSGNSLSQSFRTLVTLLISLDHSSASKFVASKSIGCISVSRIKSL